MKYTFALLTILTLFSCQSRKARQYVNQLDATERRVFRILIDKNVEDKRLEALIADQPALALTLGKRQADTIKAVIAQMDNLIAYDLPDADALKKTTTAYYKTVLRMKELDMLEAELMAATMTEDTTKVRKAQNEIFNLARKRLAIQRDLGNKDQARHLALKKFNESNKLSN